MTYLFKNNAVGRLAFGISDSATTLVLTEGDGGKFPSPQNENEWFEITVILADLTYEIMRVTSRNLDSLTVMRAQGGTSAKVFPSDTIVENRVTAGFLEKTQSDISRAQSSVVYAATKSAGDTLASSLPDGATVIVDRDESLGGVEARYTVSGGVLGAADNELDAGQVKFTQAGTGAVATTVQSKLRETVSVFDFMTAAQIADVKAGTASIDVTAAIQAAHAASRQVHYPPGRYKVTMANNAALVTFTSQTDIRITSDAAVIYDPRAYTGDPFAPVFDFVGCKDVAVDLNYEGAVLSDLSKNGTLGATFIRWRNGGDGLEVKANLKNCRYGILSGSYTDFSQGNNKNIKADLVTDEVGYPVAFYWVSGVDINIVSQGAHRSAYLAGVSDGKVISRWRNQRVADVHVLLTDAIVGTSSLRGCSNLYVRSTDLGSTIYGTANACVGIANSRQTSAITHENLDLGFFVRSDDVISTKVVGFKCFSGALPGGEPYYWEPTTVLRNIKVSGTVDRTGQTLAGGTAGEVFWDTTHTGTHTATVSNIVFQDICIVPSPIDTNDLVFEATGLQDVVTFQNVVVSSGSVGLGLATAPGTRICIRDSKFPELVSRGSIGQLLIENSNCGVVPAVLTVSGAGVSGSEVNGAGMTLRYKETTLTLSGASTTWALAIPLGAVVMGCVSRIMTDITGATGYLLGIGSDTSRWANVNNLAAGLATTPANYGSAALSPQVYQTTTSIVVTAKTSNFTGGTLKIGLYYFDTTGPTS